MLNPVPPDHRTRRFQHRHRRAKV